MITPTLTGLTRGVETLACAVLAEFSTIRMDLITRKTRIRRQGDLILQTGGQAMNLAIKESYGF
ncbi:MAG: hypothetical protein EBT70_13955, partial [Betaproteobacteria bacterium]|nr:hypothetical protein [Betaproteobacteria bacterium]